MLKLNLTVLTKNLDVFRLSVEGLFFSDFIVFTVTAKLRSNIKLLHQD